MISKRSLISFLGFLVFAAVSTSVHLGYNNTFISIVILFSIAAIGSSVGDGEKMDSMFATIKFVCFFVAVDGALQVIRPYGGLENIFNHLFANVQVLIFSILSAFMSSIHSFNQERKMHNQLLQPTAEASAE